MDITAGENVSVDQGIQLLVRIKTNTSNSFIFDTLTDSVLEELCIFEHKINPGFIYSEYFWTVTIDSNISGEEKLSYASTFMIVSLDS